MAVPLPGNRPARNPGDRITKICRCPNVKDMGKLAVMMLGVAVSLSVSLAGTAMAETVPAWVKDMAGYYSDGHTSRQEFVSAVRYLVDEGVVDLGRPDLGNPDLVQGTITRVIDGNTVIIDGNRIRIPLVGVERSGDGSMPHAVLARELCPVGSTAYYDVDDKQKKDRYGRTVAMVYCDTGMSLGKLMVGFGLGEVSQYWCPKSEFEHTEWREECR